MDQLPLAAKKRKRECGGSKDEAENSKYLCILAHVKPERMLRVKRIKPKTLVAYANFVEQFLEWCKVSKRRNVCGQNADKHMAIYFNALFDDGEPMNTASYTLFGWIALRVIPHSPERDLMPLSRAALTAWRGACTSKMRVGLPPQVIYRFAAFCVSLNEHWAAAAVLLQYDLYARPSEILSVKGRDLVPPVPSMCLHWGVIFGNADHDEVTKAGSSDDVVLANSPHRGYAQKILQRFGKLFLHQDLPLFRGTLAQYESLFRKFSKQYKLKKSIFTPHCIRHSGPSFDAIHNHRTLAEIQSRGRWACQASVNRYKKPGRLLLEASKLPSALTDVKISVLHDTLSSVLSHTWD